MPEADVVLLVTSASGGGEPRKMRQYVELDDVAVEAVGEEDSFVRRVGDTGDDLQDLSLGATEGE